MPWGLPAPSVPGWKSTSVPVPDCDLIANDNLRPMFIKEMCIILDCPLFKLYNPLPLSA
jgi:hypothetical protein